MILADALNQLHDGPLDLERAPEAKDWDLAQYVLSDNLWILRALLPDATPAEVKDLDGQLVELHNANGSAKPAGDRWTAPGRIVCQWPDLDLTARAVLFVMAAHGDDQGKRIFVSQRTIADALGFSTTEVIRRAQNRLIARGAVTRMRQGRHGKPTQWKLNKPK